VFQREGFVSSPLEERTPDARDVAGDLNTIASIDGVITARAPGGARAQSAGRQAATSAAAVFIKHRADKNLASQVTQIKALVVNSIEGLTYDNVTVALFPADVMPGDNATAAAPTIDKAAAHQAALPLSLMAGSASGALALFGGGLLWWRRRTPDARPCQADGRAALAAPLRKMPTADMQAAFRNTVNRVAGRS
jgi:type III secretion protein J